MDLTVLTQSGSESSSDGNSHEPTNIRKFRVVPASLIIVGLLGLALVRAPFKTSLATPAEVVGLEAVDCAIPCTAAEPTLDKSQWDKVSNGKSRSVISATCKACYDKCTHPLDYAFLKDKAELPDYVVGCPNPPVTTMAQTTEAVTTVAPKTEAATTTVVKGEEHTTSDADIEGAATKTSSPSNLLFFMIPILLILCCCCCCIGYFCSKRSEPEQS